MGPVVDMSKLPRLFYMHPIIIWSVCVLFYLAIEQSRQVIISEGFPGYYWLPPRHVIIFSPAKKIVLWINAPPIQGAKLGVKNVSFDLFSWTS